MNVRARIATLLNDQAKRRVAFYTKDIELERQRQAVESTARFVDEQMSHVKAITGDTAVGAMLEVLRDAIAQAPDEGLVVEFGVASGLTLRELAKHRTPVFGFDSFEGLPEDWRPGYDTGKFAQRPPQIRGTELVVGWFDQTLPRFLAKHREPFAFVHMDADLYSSTKTVFDLARDRFVRGTVIVFDEYFNYPGWQAHEHRAWQEFVHGWHGGFEYLNYNAMHEQVSVRLT